MNRSIMVVICDFIVLSMLSMLPGLQNISSSEIAGGAGSGGNTIDIVASQLVFEELSESLEALEVQRQELLKLQEQAFDAARAEELERLNQKLAEMSEKLSYLEKQLALTPQSMEELSPEALQKMLLKERQERRMLELENADRVAELEKVRNEQRNLAGEFAALQAEHDATKQSLDETRGTLAAKEEELLRTGNELLSTKDQLSVTSAELKNTTGELSNTRTLLANTESELDQSRTKVKEGELNYSYLQGKLSATERELAESKSSLENSQKTGYVQKLELAEAKRNLENLQVVMKKSVADLTKTKAELKALEEKNTLTTQELSQARQQIVKQEAMIISNQEEQKRLKQDLAVAEERLRSDVYQKYSSSALRLEYSLRNRRLMMDTGTDKKAYHPVVKIQDKLYLIGATSVLTQMLDKAEPYDKIYALNYKMTGAESPDPATIPAVNLSNLRRDARVALMEVPEAFASMVEPLRLLQFGELKKQGIEELYLFKMSSFGQESAPLTTRCSLSVQKSDEYLYIRNATNRSGSELKAEVGDLVMTRYGDFVGVVVALENFDGGRKQEARCFLFPDDFSLEELEKIPLKKGPDQEYFSDFCNTLKKLHVQFRELDAVQRIRN